MTERKEGTKEGSRRKDEGPQYKCLSDIRVTESRVQHRGPIGVDSGEISTVEKRKIC